MLGLSQSSLGIAGGIILFLIALRMVFESSEKVFGGMPQREPFIVPLAIPFQAGTSALASVILLRTSTTLNVWAAMLALLLAMSVTAGMLMLGHRIVKGIGERGVDALQQADGPAVDGDRGGDVLARRGGVHARGEVIDGDCRASVSDAGILTV